MAILDDKGRLFGKLNIIDFLAIVFILALLPIFYFGYKVFNKPPPPAPPAVTYTYKIDYKARYEASEKRLATERNKNEQSQNRLNNLFNNHPRIRKYY